ncbi:hypothetical protein F4815DRAFT_13190 [Daldinia loculata]|nr:hypothetical protein F4815DRAFT_13190 [Daldinia loculata]
MDHPTSPKPRPKGVLKTLSVDVKLPSPSRVTFDSVAHDIQTGDEVPPSPRTRDEFYFSVMIRRRKAKLEEAKEVRVKAETKKAFKKVAEAAAAAAVAAAEERKRVEEMRSKIAEMERAVNEAYAKAKKNGKMVGFGLNERWYSNMILCMQAVYC